MSLLAEFIGYVIYTFYSELGLQHVNKYHWPNFSNGGAEDMEIGSNGNQDDGKHRGRGFVKISVLFPTYDPFFFEIDTFDKVYLSKGQ